jgi:hypothetical protein
MNATLPRILFCLLLFCRLTTGFSQILSPGLVAKFGIDGDLRSDERQNGTFTAAGSHDWFKRTSGTGIGTIDTTGAAGWRTQLLGGANIAFSRRMPYERYSIQDDVVMLDACYARDFMSNDKTAFTGNGTKNTAAPADWGTAPSGGNVSDKTDILDTYVSMRRNGTQITGSNIGSLVATMGLSTLATSGDRYADFEFYKERVNYNTTTGKFENSGPALYGGHSLWEFNADGSIRNWGDMTISFTFNGSSVSDIRILIWVAQTTFQQVVPKTFDFTTEFYASTSVSSYGYAAIKAKGSALVALGAVNTGATAVPIWGSNSKELGGNGNFYFTDVYAVGQFAEAAVDFTALGIDPATFTAMNACNPPFTRFLAKSRSSNSFASSLSDFNGPFEFLDVPIIPSNIAPAASITCLTPSVTLSPTTYYSGSWYRWRTNDGHISESNSDSSTITINKAGTYYLSAAITPGCNVSIDSLVVPEDKSKPVATADVSDMLFPGQQVTLFGGDPIASNYTTPFGGSQGLLWDWKGPTGFTSTLQNPKTGVPGYFTLRVTEKRNGCVDTAFVYVTPYPTLAVQFTAFTVAPDRQNGTCRLTWSVADSFSIKSYRVERNTGNGFSVLATFNAANQTSFTDRLQSLPATYRIGAEDKQNRTVYSTVVGVDPLTNPKLAPVVFVNAQKEVFARVVADQDDTMAFALSNLHGQVISQGQLSLIAGDRQYRVPVSSGLQPGIYIVQLQSRQGNATVKLRL